MRARSRRTRSRRRRGPSRARGGAAPRMGRRDDRVPPPPDRQPVLHAQSRGNRKGAGRRASGSPKACIAAAIDVDEPRSDGAAADRCSTRTATALARDGTRRRCRRDDPGGRRHAAQHGARARGRRALRPRRQVPPRLPTEEGQPVKVVRGLAKPATPAVLTDVRAAAARRVFGDLHRRSTATSSRRWRARSRATRSCRGCSREGHPADAGSDARFSRRSTGSSARPSSASSAWRRRSSGRRAWRRPSPHASRRAVRTGCTTTRRSRACATARGS